MPPISLFMKVWFFNHNIWDSISYITIIWCYLLTAAPPTLRTLASMNTLWLHLAKSGS